jgi:hypothetical protein
LNFKIIFSAFLLDTVGKGDIIQVINKATCHENVKASGGMAPVLTLAVNDGVW